jgi:hypothetical protein
MKFQVGDIVKAGPKCPLKFNFKGMRKIRGVEGGAKFPYEIADTLYKAGELVLIKRPRQKKS